MPKDGPSITTARICLVLASLLWSLGSPLTRVAQHPVLIGWNEPGLTPLQIALFRALFAGLVMIPFLRRTDVVLRPTMVGMMLAFTAMNGLYLTALGFGSAASAIFLQNTGPLWLCVIGVSFLGDVVSRRGWQAVLLGAAGAVVIVAGNWPRHATHDVQRTQIMVLCMGVFSGVLYATVLLCLRALRDYAPTWLVFLNHLGSAIVFALFILLTSGAASLFDLLTAPSARQIAFLILFGSIQMALPYWLFTRGVQVVGPLEAGIITLIEPLINPIWAYLITPEQDTPTPSMLLGGALILTALVWRFLPTRSARLD